MEPVELNVVSPVIEMPGIDAAIERMTELAAIYDKLREAANSPITMRVNAEGVEGVNTAVAGMGQGIQKQSEFTKQLIMRLKEVGDAGPSIGKLEAGFASAADEAKYLGELYEKLEVRRRQLARDPMNLVNPDRLNSVDAAKNLTSLRVDEIAEQSRETVEAANGKKLFAEAGEKAAVSEKNLQGASEQSAAALEAQDAIIKAKLLSLASLETRLSAAAQAEREFNAAAREAASSGEGAGGKGGKGLLSSRTVFGKKGDVTTDTVRNKDGSISKISDGEELSEEKSQIEEHYRELRKIEADYKAKQGHEDSGSAGSIELTRRHAQEIRDEVNAMQLKGLGEEKLAQDQITRANDLEARASRQQRTLDQKTGTGFDAAAQDMLLNTSREWQQQLDRQFLANKAQAQSQLDIVKATRAQADGYRELHNELKGLGQSDTTFGRMIGGRADRYEGKAAEMEAEARRQIEAARRLSQEFESESYNPANKQTKHTVNETDSGKTVTRQLESEMNGYRNVIKLQQEYNASGELVAAAQQKITTKMEEGKPAASGMGAAISKMGATLGTVALWMTAYEAFFAVVNALKSGVAGMVEMEAHTAQLQSVMRGTKEQAQEMRDVVMGLAVAEGRSGDEAMDAAVRWERLALSKRDATEAVDISLKSANISGMTAAQSAEQFSAIYASYALSVAQLGTVFQETNAMAVRFNAADKDIMAGLARTGSVAHVAGMEISQTMALVAEITGRTRRPGAESGNALKRLFTNLSKPDVQAGLDKDFGISVKDSHGELKKESQILDELYLKYISLGKAEQQALLIRVAGAQQASRIAALMDGYVHAQGLEIQALGDLNRAEIENKVRRDTMQKDLQALATEWQKLWVAMGDSSGALTSLKEVMAGLIRLSELSDKFQKTKVGGFIVKMDKLMLEDFFGLLPLRLLGSNKDNKEATADARQRMTEEYDLENLRRNRERMSQISSRSGLMAKEVGAQRDPEKLRRDLDQYTSTTFDNRAEREAFERKLASADNEGKIALLLERQKATKADMIPLDDKVQSARKALIDKEQTHLDLLNDQISAKAKAGEDTKALEADRDHTRQSLDQFNGKTYDHNEVDDDAEDPSQGYEEMKKKYELMAAARKKIADAYPAMGDKEEDKIARERAALDAKEAMIAAHPEMPDGLRTDMAKEIRDKREALEIDEEAAKVQDRIAEATKRAKNESAQFRTGRNETEEDFNEAGGVGGMIGGMADAAKAGDVDSQAEVLQLGSRLTAIQLDLEERRYRLAAGIVNEKRKENEEASKSLMMADREEQLQAALIRKFTQQHGAFTSDNFQFLEQKTKQSVQKYDPDALPPEMMTRSRELEQESAMLTRNLGGLSAAIQRTTDWIRGNVHPNVDGRAPVADPWNADGKTLKPFPRNPIADDLRDLNLARQQYSTQVDHPSSQVGPLSAWQDEMAKRNGIKMDGGGKGIDDRYASLIGQLEQKMKAPQALGPVAPQIQAPVVNVNMQFSDQFRQMTEHVGGVVRGELMGQINEMRSTWSAFTSGRRTESAQQAGTNGI